MKIFLLSLFSVLIIFYGCSSKTTEKYPNGQIKSEGYINKGKMQGEWKYYYENGKLKASGYFLNGNGLDIITDGIPNDGLDKIWIFYNENGNKTSEIEYIDSKLSKKVDFFDNGKKKFEVWYLRDSIPNHFCYYYKSGKLRDEYFIEKDVKGNLEVRANNYYENGELEFIEKRINDSIISVYFYKENGDDLGARIEKNYNYLYYTSRISKDDAEKYLDRILEVSPILKKADSTFHYAHQIDKRLDTYEYHYPIKKGLENDNQVINSLKMKTILYSKRIFNGAKVDIHCCDDNFNTLRVVPYAGR